MLAAIREEAAGMGAEVTAEGVSPRGGHGYVWLRWRDQRCKVVYSRSKVRGSGVTIARKRQDVRRAIREMQRRAKGVDKRSR